jgi:hypothetical protein
MVLKPSALPPAASSVVQITKGDLAKMAKPGCTRCYGRGFKTTMQDGTKVLCACAAKGLKALLDSRKAAAQAKGGAA